MGDHFDALLAAASDGGVDCDGLVVAETGDGYRFETPSVSRTGIDEADLRRAVDANAPIVNNWYYWHEVLENPTRRAFLRYLERAGEHDYRERRRHLTGDGIERTWGQLHVTTWLDEDGERVHELRHVDDADVPAADLERHEDPLSARDLVKHDEKGRYRPLKTAPSLPTGWRFAALSGRDCYETVDYVYPATVANWHREREGELDVEHFQETGGRQTGIYDIVDELTYEQVDDIAAACCDDSQCLKRREWQYDEDHELTADGGTGAFPCREPCSLVVAASRKWTTLEREEPRTYEFELTPSEKEQLEDIVAAVADDRVDDIREADVYKGANRYRTRYLREKLFDEHGRLCGVPTEAEHGDHGHGHGDHEDEDDEEHDGDHGDDHEDGHDDHEGDGHDGHDDADDHHDD